MYNFSLNNKEYAGNSSLSRFLYQRFIVLHKCKVYCNTWNMMPDIWHLKISQEEYA